MLESKNHVFTRFAKWTARVSGKPVSGENKSYTVSTDKNGMYEIWDLRAGKYKISPEIPKGYKTRFSIENGLFEYKEIKGTNEVAPNESRLAIKKRGCGGRDFVVNKKD